jgi:uncharacterized protein YggE
MTRSSLLLAGLLSIAAPSFAQTSPAQSARSEPVVVTHGDAIVKRAPDRAWLTIATETRASKAPEARERSAQAMRAVQDALRNTGLPADAIRTTGYSLHPEMDWNDGRGVIRGYVVRNQIEVRVDNLDRLGDVIDAANNTNRNTALNIQGPRFALRDEQAAETEALRLAVQAAMARAEAIASGAKRSVGQIVRIEERPTEIIMPPQPMFRTTAAEASTVQTPITPGEIEVRAQVTLTVELR